MLFCCELFVINNVQLLEKELLSLLLLRRKEVTQEIATGVIPLRDPQCTHGNNPCIGGESRHK